MSLVARLLVGEALNDAGASHLKHVYLPAPRLVAGEGNEIAAGAILRLDLVIRPIGELDLLGAIRTHDPDVEVGHEGGLGGEGGVNAAVAVEVYAVAAEREPVRQATGSPAWVPLLRGDRILRQVRVGNRPGALARVHPPGQRGEFVPDVAVHRHPPGSFIAHAPGAADRHDRSRGQGLARHCHSEDANEGSHYRDARERGVAL